MPVAMQEDHGSRQLFIVVNDELHVSHGFITLVGKGRVLSSNSILRIIHLVDDMRDVAQVKIKPGCILHNIRC